MNLVEIAKQLSVRPMFKVYDPHVTFLGTGLLLWA